MTRKLSILLYIFPPEYPPMQKFLARTGRDIVFSTEYPAYQKHDTTYKVCFVLYLHVLVYTIAVLHLSLACCPLWGDKASMLIHIYLYKPLWKIEVTICKISRLTAHSMCGLMSDLLICMFIKRMVIHDTECPFWDKVSLTHSSLSSLASIWCLFPNA